MTKVATMGTSSCATIALQGFKDPEIKRNEAYRADPTSFNEAELETTVGNFYSKVLYPTRQDLGRSDDYPFDLLMDRIDNGSLATKFIIVTLNAYQMTVKDGYWPKVLAERGFVAIDKTKNAIGSVNTVFTRNNNRVD